MKWKVLVDITSCFSSQLSRVFQKADDRGLMDKKPQSWGQGAIVMKRTNCQHEPPRAFWGWYELQFASHKPGQVHDKFRFLSQFIPISDYIYLYPHKRNWKS